MVFVSIGHVGFSRTAHEVLIVSDGFSRTAHEVLSPMIMMDFQGLLMRCFLSMSRDDFPSAPRKFLFFKRSQICCLISSCSVFLGHCSHSCQDLV